jgi:NAD(P)-dependent dehydrogenase (short-subunit alcohol dehydrogenase family)
MARLQGRAAIVTGGARGIGAHYSRALAAEGTRVMIADIADGTELAGELAASHGANSVASAMFDVSDETQVRALVAQTIERFGKIDVLVNNAAVFANLQPQPTTEIDVELWDRVMAVNVRGPFLMVKHVVPHMIAQKYGKIINITSGTVKKGLTGMLHYTSSKGAMQTFTRTLSRELGEHNICVNSLAPGLTLSDTLVLSGTHDEARHKASVQSRAFKRDESPQDLLGTLIFLASADSDFITGQTIAVDGGSTNT